MSHHQYTGLYGNQPLWQKERLGYNPADIGQVYEYLVGHGLLQPSEGEGQFPYETFKEEYSGLLSSQSAFTDINKLLEQTQPEYYRGLYESGMELPRKKLRHAKRGLRGYGRGFETSIERKKQARSLEEAYREKSIESQANILGETQSAQDVLSSFQSDIESLAERLSDEAPQGTTDYNIDDVGALSESILEDPFSAFDVTDIVGTISEDVQSTLGGGEEEELKWYVGEDGSSHEYKYTNGQWIPTGNYTDPIEYDSSTGLGSVFIHPTGG